MCRSITKHNNTKLTTAVEGEVVHTNVKTTTLVTLRYALALVWTFKTPRPEFQTHAFKLIIWTGNRAFWAICTNNGLVHSTQSTTTQNTSTSTNT